MFCPKCGKENPEGARFCASCGEDMMIMSSCGGNKSGGQCNNSKPLDTTGLLYVLLSIFIPGIGHICFGQVGKGFLILVSFFICAAAGLFLLFPFILAVAIWILCLWDLIKLLRSA
jgi:TM2 domain-containing membrane protein YozV